MHIALSDDICGFLLSYEHMRVLFKKLKMHKRSLCVMNLWWIF